MFPAAELKHRDSPPVKDALTRKCEICGAGKAQWCTDTISGTSLWASQGRHVHMVRVEL